MLVPNMRHWQVQHKLFSTKNSEIKIFWLEIENSGGACQETLNLIFAELDNSHKSSDRLTSVILFESSDTAIEFQ